MKFKSIILAIAACATLVSVSSCSKDFLDEHSYKFDTSGFYNSQEEIIMGLNSVYSEVAYMMMGAQRTHHSYMINGCGLDTFIENSNNDCFSNWDKLIPDNGYSRHWSDYMYQMINRANVVLDMMEERPDIKYTNEEMKNTILGETKFLRAWAYRALAAFYGNTPLLTKRSQEAKFDYEPVSREEIWAFCKAEFAEAENLLPKEPRLEGCVVKATAAAHLAEMCLALGEFAEAEKAATRVIDKTDGDYEIMTARFGSRAKETTYRTGEFMAPTSAYWDLFREGGNQKRSNGNKEVLWAIQYNYGTYETGGGGDSWFRTHFNYIECGWLPGYLQNPTNSGITMPTPAAIPADKKAKADAFIAKYGFKYSVPDPEDPKKAKANTDTEKDNTYTIYKYGIDLACLPYWEPKPGEEEKDRPDWAKGTKVSTSVTEGINSGRMEAQIARDSIGGRCQGNGATGGQCELPSLAMYNAMQHKVGGPTFGYWDDVENDLRGPANMIQCDYYLPGGTKWSDAKKYLYERQEAGIYTLTPGDTITWSPRLWKFSDDRHPNGNTTAYDCDWYMMRVAEVYLLRAEARLAQGNAGGAAEDINVVRKRAGASEITGAVVDIDYILDERARELFGEEHRQVTLNRLSCNPKCGSYVTSKYPVQDATTSNTLYERTKKYGFVFENAIASGVNLPERAGSGGLHEPNIHPWNYQNPVPIEVIQANTGCVMPQNPGY